jgi:hypothetical protein
MKPSTPSPTTPGKHATNTTSKSSLRKFIGIEEDPAYRWVLFVFGILAAANILSYFVGTTNLSFLKASKFQPWGAVTSIGPYDSWESTIALPMLALFWFLLNTRIVSSERRRRSLLLIIGSACAAIIANIAWLFSKSQFEFAMGVSGFEVAVGGVMLVFTLANLSSLRFHEAHNLIQLRATDKNSIAFVYMALAAMLISTWVTLIDLSGASINTEVHVVSLAIAIGLAAGYELTSALKSRRFSGHVSLRLPSTHILRWLGR